MKRLITKFETLLMVGCSVAAELLLQSVSLIVQFVLLVLFGSILVPLILVLIVTNKLLRCMRSIQRRV